MVETLLALLLVASSAKDSSLVFWWPPSPQAAPRLARPRPSYDGSGISQYDNAWIASNSTELPTSGTADNAVLRGDDADDDDEYEWRPPASYRDRSISFSSSRSRSRSGSGPGTPFNDDSYLPEPSPEMGGYDDLLDFRPGFLANLLCPQDGKCHQKFELSVDNLAFLGHPVSAEKDRIWRFKPEKIRTNTRGREHRNRTASQYEDTHSSTSSKDLQDTSEGSGSYPLHKFHFVLVLDIPDPSSAAAGNVSKYLDVIYEQIAFRFTAVLFQEQVLSNFVAVECDALTSLREDYMAKGLLFADFVEEALKLSSIASSMKVLFEALKKSSIAYMTIHGHPLELQLPPYLDFLLHSEEVDEMDYVNWPEDDGEAESWGSNMSVGWRLPALQAWKGLLLLDDCGASDLFADFNGPQVSLGDRALVEGLIRFLETASVTISLADVASLLDWDLELEVFPTVRWLVYHRRAKIVDIVHPRLKTVFTIPPKFDSPLAKLTAEFEKEFAETPVPPLPQILSMISTSASKQSDFFSSVVPSKDSIPLYHGVIIWMLKRDMLVTLHLCIRVVATQELKLRVKLARDRARAKRAKAGSKNTRKHTRQDARSDHEDPRPPPSKSSWLSFFPGTDGKRLRRTLSTNSGNSILSELVLKESDGEVNEESDEDDGYGINNDEDNEGEVYGDDSGEEEEWEEDQDENMFWDNRENYITPTMINDPGRATPMQRRWLSAMSEGKDPTITKRFEQINQYFDGKRTDDEILYRAEITRRQLREVLHTYEEYLQTFLHPS